MLSLLVFAAIPDYYDDNYPNFTPDQKANYILSMEGGLNLEEARALLLENKMSSSVKRSLGKEYFKTVIGVSVFEITDKAEFNLVVKSTDYLETKLTSVAVSQLKLLAKAPNVKGFKILADGKIDVKSDKTSLFDMSEIAMCTLGALAHSKQAISEHAQELRKHAPHFSAEFLTFQAI